MILSNNQIEYIQDFLNRNEVTHDELSEELLDHIATQIEQKIEAGLSFQVAATSSFESFQKDEMQEIQSQIISLNQKQFIMKSRTLKWLFGISIAISSLGFILDMNERVDDIYLNLFEISMMSLIIFTILCAITGIGIFVKRSFSKE